MSPLAVIPLSDPTCTLYRQNCYLRSKEKKGKAILLVLAQVGKVTEAGCSKDANTWAFNIFPLLYDTNIEHTMPGRDRF
jgi:hypothetical protein